MISKDGEEVAKSERVEVEVQDFDAIVTEITEVSTSVNGQTIAENQLGLNDTAQLKVLAKTKSAEEAVNMTSGAQYSVDKPAVLSVSASGKVEANAKGTATVTIKLGDLTETVTYTVGDARKLDVVASTIDKSEVVLAANKTAKVTVELKDQYGLAFDGTVTADNAKESSVLAKKAETSDVVQVLDEEGTAIPGKYEITLTAASEAATGDVIVKVGNTELGTVSLTVQEAGEVDSYELSSTTNTEFDLKTDTKGTTSKKLQLKTFDANGLETNDSPVAIDGTSIKLVSSDENVATIHESNKDEVVLASNAKAGDTVTIQVVKVTGAFEDVLDEIEITVIDSTPEITDVQFTSSTVTQNSLAVDFSELASVTATGSKGEVEVSYQKDDNTLQIVEDGTSVVLGTVTFAPTVVLSSVEDNVVTFDNAVSGNKVIASFIDNDNNFLNQVELAFEPKEFNNSGIASDSNFMVYGLTSAFDKESTTEPIDDYTSSQKVSDIDTVVKFLEVQYGATLNKDNLELTSGKAKITGPLLSAEDFKKIKGDKSGNYNITLLDNSGQKNKIAKIVIKPDGSAYFEAIPAK